jgi:hypothetical protein
VLSASAAGAQPGSAGSGPAIGVGPVGGPVTLIDMTPDRRSLGLPAFSEPATDTAVPAPSSGRRLPPVEAGADFRQPPGEEVQEPQSARRPLAVGGLTFSDPGSSTAT